MRATFYITRDATEARSQGEDLGLRGEALQNFINWQEEIRVVVEVDLDTGDCEVVDMDQI